MGDQGIKIAKDGINAPDATDQQLIFTSAHNHLKLVKVGTASYTFSSNPGTGTLTLATIAHGLSFTPGHDGHYQWNDPSSYTQNSVLPWVIVPSWGLAWTIYTISLRANATNLYIIFDRTDVGGGAPIDLTGHSFDFDYAIYGDNGA